MIRLTFLFALAGAFLLHSCSSTRKTNEQDAAAVGVPMSFYQVYKTSGDYFFQVPVQLSDDKSKIVSYPASTDLMKGDDFTLPVRLADGYLLDRRGIGTNTAFIEWTYEVFTESGGASSVEELRNMIVDDNPITELFRCELKMSEAEAIEQINSMIRDGSLSSRCIRIK